VGANDNTTTDNLIYKLKDDDGFEMVSHYHWPVVGAQIDNCDETVTEGGGWFTDRQTIAIRPHSGTDTLVHCNDPSLNRDGPALPELGGQRWL
jgi:hypothetical protein